VEEGIFTVTSTINSGPENMPQGSSSTKQDDPPVFVPLPRYSSGMVIKQGIIYLYGGTFEDKDERQITFNDFYCLGGLKSNVFSTFPNIILNLRFQKT